MTSAAHGFDSIIDLIDESVLVSAPGEVILGWNKGAQALYGWSAQEALGRTVPELLTCRPDRPRSEILDIVREQGSWTGEAWRRTRTGDEVLASISWKARRNDGAFELYETSRNLGGRRDLEISLDRAQKLANTLFQSGSAAYRRLDLARVLPMVSAIKAGGVRDLRSYLANNRPVVLEMMNATRVIDVNERTIAWQGHDRQQILDGRLSQLWPAEAERFFSDCVIGLAEGEMEAAAEIMVRNAEGRTLDALFTAHFTPSIKPDGSLVVAVSEITDRNKAQQAVARSDYRYRRLFPALAAGYWELDMRAMNARLDAIRATGVDDLTKYAEIEPGFVDEAMGLITVNDVNEQTVEMMGVASRAELIGLPVSGFWPEEAKPAFLGALNAGFQGRDWSDRETRLKRPDGQVVDVLFSSASPPHMREIGIAVLSVTDITERRHAERRLTESEYRSRKLFEAMALGIWELDFREMKAYVYDLVARGELKDLFQYWREHPDFVTTMMSKVRVVEVNAKTLELFGGKTQEDMRVDLGRYWPPESHHFFLQTVYHTSVLKHDKFEAETKLRRLDGSTFDGLFTSWELPEITEANHVLVGVVDITEKVAARKELLRVREEMAHASRVSMLGELTASIAHELNQPLAAIATLGEANRRWLDREEVNLDKVRELNGRVISDAQRAADIIARIRKMAVPASVVHGPTDVNDVVRDAVKFLDHEILARGANVATTLAPGLPQVRGDAIQLQQVFVNLMVNAMQAMQSAESATRKVTIESRATGDDQIEIVVTDTGPGIPPDAVDRIFQSFYTTKSNGMGIGLPICRTIVESFGGTIDLVQGTQGAAFRIVLPVTPGDVQ